MVVVALLAAGVVQATPAAAEPEWDWSLITMTMPPGTMHPGEKLVLTAVLRNEGTRSWSADAFGPNPVRLTNRLGPSAFASSDPSWTADALSIRMATPTVGPKEHALFVFTFTAPTTPGDYEHRLVPSVEGVLLMDLSINFQTTVRRIVGAAPPLPNPGLPAASAPCLPFDGQGGFNVAAPEGAVAAGYAFGTPLFEGMGTPGFVATDPFGKIVVTDSATNRVHRVDEEGNLLFSWGGPGTSPGRFAGASGVAVSPSGLVFVADSGNRRIQVFTLSGTFVTSIGGFTNPRGLAFVTSGPDAGSLVVADAGASHLDVRGPSGVRVRTIGSEGGLPGQFRSPQAVAVSGGDVYVADTGNHRVQRLTLTGDVVAVIGGRGNGTGCLDTPSGIAANATGVFVSDTIRDRIVHYTTSGMPLESWGRTGADGGQLRRPLGLTLEGGGNVWVAEGDGARIQRFRPRALVAPCLSC